MIVIISGPSGVGKDTIIKQLRRLASDPPRHFVVTYKTRPPRNDEIEGVHYQFVGVPVFRALDRAGRLLEASEVHGHWSGTPRDQVVAAIRAGEDVILKIDVQGAEKVKALVPDALRIFVAPPSEADREAWLAGRGTESAEELARRNRDAELEMRHMSEYDYVVVNEVGRFDQTARRIDEIIRNEHEQHPDRQISI
jgi:guanylate kinase